MRARRRHAHRTAHVMRRLSEIRRETARRMDRAEKGGDRERVRRSAAPRLRLEPQTLPREHRSASQAARLGTEIAGLERTNVDLLVERDATDHLLGVAMDDRLGGGGVLV